MNKLATITCKFETVTIELGIEDGQEVDNETLIAHALGAAIDAGDIEIEIAELTDNVLDLPARLQ